MRLFTHVPDLLTFTSNLIHWIRTYEQVADVGLFLFDDALVLTRRTVRHTPFALAPRSAHAFLASVALGSLSVREIAHSRCECSGFKTPRREPKRPLTDEALLPPHPPDVSHAFVLTGPRRSWVCAAERAEERDHFLSVLRSAISCAVTDQ